MKHLWIVAFAVACGGKDNCEDFPPLPVDVTVLDPAGDPVEGAPVEMDGAACTENGGGSYACEVIDGGAGQLSIVDGRYNAHSEFLELPEPACEPETFAVTVTLDAMMGA